jgi:hypothetical protein
MVNIIHKIRVTKSSKLPKWLRIGNYYWIEYRIDEDRYWYCQKKGLKRKETWHSKKDLIGAIDIIRGIISRSKNEGYDVDIIIDEGYAVLGNRAKLEKNTLFLNNIERNDIYSELEED